MITSIELKQKIKVIENIIKDVKEKQNLSNSTDIENYFWENHSSLMNSYPFLISQIISGGDRSMLDLMVSKLEEIEKGETTKNEADLDLGQELADKYLNKFK
jgi:hypothetical protein